jgi:hypothetical protein
MEIGKQLLDLEQNETLAGWYVRVLLDEGAAYLVKLTEHADVYAVVSVLSDNDRWTLLAGFVDLAKASYVDVRRAFEFSCGVPTLELTDDPAESEIVMLLFAEDTERWEDRRWTGYAATEPLAPLVERALDRLVPSAPPEVCSACLERTGGVAVPPFGQHFAVGLAEPIRVGGRVWGAADDAEEPGLYPVERSDLAPYHLVAVNDEQRQPVCMLPAAKVEVYTVDD